MNIAPGNVTMRGYGNNVVAWVSSSNSVLWGFDNQQRSGRAHSLRDPHVSGRDQEGLADFLADYFETDEPGKHMKKL